MDLGGPYDVVFDRGVYHGIRTGNLPGFLKMLERVTRKGTRWLCLAGNAKEPMVTGPPVVSEEEFRTELGPLLKILEVREFRFTLDREDFRPLAWSILMERRGTSYSTRRLDRAHCKVIFAQNHERLYYKR